MKANSGQLMRDRIVFQSEIVLKVVRLTPSFGRVYTRVRLDRRSRADTLSSAEAWPTKDSHFGPQRPQKGPCISRFLHGVNPCACVFSGWF
jgi:hypothetical protein